MIFFENFWGNIILKKIFLKISILINPLQIFGVKVSRIPEFCQKQRTVEKIKLKFPKYRTFLQFPPLKIFSHLCRAKKIHLR